MKFLLFFHFRSGTPYRDVSITFEKEHDLVEVYPSYIEILPDGPTDFMISVVGKSPGHLHIRADITPDVVIK